jgi:hypothetical protein
MEKREYKTLLQTFNENSGLLIIITWFMLLGFIGSWGTWIASCIDKVENELEMIQSINDEDIKQIVNEEVQHHIAQVILKNSLETHRYEIDSLRFEVKSLGLYMNSIYDLLYPNNNRYEHTDNKLMYQVTQDDYNKAQVDGERLLSGLVDKKKLNLDSIMMDIDRILENNG